MRAAPECSAPDLAKRNHITYRQLDHWIRQGYVQGGTPGSGNARDLSELETEVLQHMSTFVRAGFPPRLAARFAREIVEAPE